MNGKVAVITGGSRGIGFAIAQALVGEHCSVVITSRSAAQLQVIAKTFQASDTTVLPCECDVRNESHVKRLFALVRKKFGALDFLVNNAAIYGPAKPLAEVSLEGWRETLDINLTGMFLCTKYALPLMKAGSVIVNNLSVAAYQVFQNSAAYIASKQGALGLTNATREEVRERGIRVVALVPGATDTDMWNQFWPGAPREKMMSPDDVANVVVNALKMPKGTSVDEIRIMPASGKL
ncbi:MAG TPA: SDR family NAD(P)-dependent oxidoreductase [Terriglobales bacterium]|nr:SDR family NAD(P)-dependent oxidoreductase [Terriglobales bacterium]